MEPKSLNRPFYPTTESKPRTFTKAELAGTFRHTYQSYAGPMCRYGRLEINRVLTDGWVELKAKSSAGKPEVVWSGCLSPEVAK